MRHAQAAEMVAVDLRRSAGIYSTAILALGFLVLLSIGCRNGSARIDPRNDNGTHLGTLTGTIRGVQGAGAVEGRAVEVINVDTNERQRVTSNAAGFTLKVKPGKYRVQVALQDGESIVKQPGLMHVSAIDADAHADFVIESVRAARPRRLSTPVDPALGSPIV
jgi:hypothetical protein